MEDTHNGSNSQRHQRTSFLAVAILTRTEFIGVSIYHHKEANNQLYKVNNIISDNDTIHDSYLRDNKVYSSDSCVLAACCYRLASKVEDVSYIGKNDIKRMINQQHQHNRTQHRHQNDFNLLLGGDNDDNIHIIGNHRNIDVINVEERVVVVNVNRPNVDAVDNIIESTDILQLEASIVTNLKFELYIATVVDYLDPIIAILCPTSGNNRLHDNMRNMCFYLADLTLLFSELLRDLKPSHLTAAIILYCRQLLEIEPYWIPEIGKLLNCDINIISDLTYGSLPMIHFIHQICFRCYRQSFVFRYFNGGMDFFTIPPPLANLL